MAGPAIRTDLFDVYVFRLAGGALEALQLRRVEKPLAGTWQPVMGHAEANEGLSAALWRELREETGLTPGDRGFRGAWALEGVHPYYLPSQDAVMLSPRFAVQVSGDWSPRLDGEHDAVRWVREDAFESSFMWPGQRAALAELCALMQRRGSDAETAQRLGPPPTG